MIARTTCVFIACATCLAQNSVYPVSGRVVDSVSGEALRKIHVTLTDSKTLLRRQSVITGADGRFAFLVPEGRYSLHADRDGFFGQSYGQRNFPSGLSVAVVAGPGQKTDQLVFRMVPSSSISGRIVDEAGDPVEDALVQLFRSSITSGRRAVSRGGWSYTDDRGEYRIPSIVAGDYYIAVSATPWHSSVQQPLAYPMIFYPGVHEWRAASLLHLQFGEEAKVNLSLAAAPAATITVTCDAQVGAATVSVVADRLMETETIAAVRRVGCPSGDLGAFAPGSYLIRSRRESGTDPNPLVASERVVVSSSNPIRVRMDFRTAPTLTGKVELGGLDENRLVLSLRAQEEGVSASHGVLADGTFTFPGVAPGLYRLVVSQPPGIWAQQLMVDGKAPAGGVFEISADHAPSLYVVPASGLAHLSGKVVRGGQPASGAMVVLAPKSSSTDPGDFGIDRSNSDGSFEMKNVRAGDYYLFALDVDDLEYLNRAAIQPYLAGAKPVHIESGRDDWQEVPLR